MLALLKDQHSLIILDNAEHLDGFGEHVRELVDSCDRAHLLVTSRSPLGASGERVFSVAPLDADDALSLLVERVRAHRVGFAPTAEENEFLRAIARRLDGLPLALELAAARLRALPPAALLRRLDRQLDLLTSESADLPPRQRTMRGAIQWSHDMLSGQDQALFASLAVFRSPAALSTVAALNQADEIQTLDGLTRLIDASLVRPGVAHTEPRYWMLEPIRQFAAERLHECGLDEILCRRLLSDLAEAASRAWADDADVFALFADEVDTVLNALEDAVALDEWNLGLTLADVVTRTVLVPMGVQTQLARWVDQAEQHRGSLNDIAQARLLCVGAWARILSLPEVLARWQEAAALLSRHTGYAPARRDVDRRRDQRLASRPGRHRHRGAGRGGMSRMFLSVLKAMAAMARAQFAAIAHQSDAPDLYRLADELATASGDFSLAVHVRNDRAYTTILTGDYRRALTLVHSAIEMADRRGVANFATLHTAAVAALALGDVANAAHHLQRILVTYDRLGMAADDTSSASICMPRQPSPVLPATRRPLRSCSQGPTAARRELGDRRSGGRMLRVPPACRTAVRRHQPGSGTPNEVHPSTGGSCSGWRLTPSPRRSRPSMCRSAPRNREGGPCPGRSRPSGVGILTKLPAEPAGMRVHLACGRAAELPDRVPHMALEVTVGGQPRPPVGAGCGERASTASSRSSGSREGLSPAV